MGAPTAPGGNQHREFPQTTSKRSSKTTPKPLGLVWPQAGAAFQQGSLTGLCWACFSSAVSGGNWEIRCQVLLVPPSLGSHKGWEAAAKGSGKLGTIPEAEEDWGQHRSKDRAGTGSGIPRDQGRKDRPQIPPSATAPDLLSHENTREIWFRFEGKRLGRTWGAQSLGRNPLLQKHGMIKVGKAL